MKKITKRFFVIGLCLVFTMGLLCSCSSSNGGGEGSGDVTTWEFYSSYGQQDGACCEVWQELAKQIEEETDGRLVINISWYGQHPYEGEDMLKTVKDGTCQMTNFYSQYAEAAEPALAVEAQPLLFPTDKLEAFNILSELWGNYEQDTNGAMEKILEENWNSTCVFCMPAASQTLFTAGYEAVTENSLAGHKIRVQGEATSQFVQALGGTPVSIGLSDLYTSLSTNLVDGCITSPLFGNNYGIFDFLDTSNDWQISSATDALIVNLDALNALPDDVKETFLKIMQDRALAPETLEIDQNEEVVKDTLVPNGLSEVVPSEDTRNNLRKVMEKKCWNEWLESAGENGQLVLDQVNELMK